MKKTIAWIAGLSFSILIIGLTLVILYFDYKKAELKENKNIEEIKLKQEIEAQRQESLRTCIKTAELSRELLWDANCPENEKNCSLNSSTIEWIDSRYDRDIKNCNSLYK